jgi:MFS family permease
MSQKRGSRMSAMAEEGGFRPAGEALSRRDVRTLTLASLGGALEFYDFVVFGFFAPVIAALFFPPDMPAWLSLVQAYGLFSVGYFARPLGGIVMAHFGDLIGRKRMFILSVLLMAVPTLLIGLMPTYASIGYAAPLLLVVLRIMQGIAIGGEAPGAWVFVSEHVPRHRVGLAVGMLTAGLTLGILIGSLVQLLVNSTLTEAQILDYGWRLPFLAGGVFGLVAMYLRRFLEESPIFEAMRARAETVRGLPLAVVFREHWRKVLASVLATWMLTAAVMVIILMTPQVLHASFGFSRLDASLANVVANIALTISAVAVGVALDRFGQRIVLPVASTAFVAGAYLLYYGAAQQPHLLVPLYAVAGFCVGAVTIVPYMMVQAFPANVRFSGVSFSYNTAYAVFGGLTPVLVSALSHLDRFAPAHYIAIATAVGTVAMLLAPRR